MFISQPPCGDACIFESSAAAGSHISTTAGVSADIQPVTCDTCQSTGIEQPEQCSTSLIGNICQLHSPTSISNSILEADSTSLSSLSARPEIGIVSSTCVSTQNAVRAEPFDTSDAKPQAYAAAVGQCATTHQPDMPVCAAEQDKQTSQAACEVEQGHQIHDQQQRQQIHGQQQGHQIQSQQQGQQIHDQQQGQHIHDQQQGQQIHDQQQGQQIHDQQQVDQIDEQQQRQQIGILRKKPGRGEPTLSMSCSDKLARWGLLGVQVSPASHWPTFTNTL